MTGGTDREAHGAHLGDAPPPSGGAPLVPSLDGPAEHYPRSTAPPSAAAAVESSAVGGEPSRAGAEPVQGNPDRGYRIAAAVVKPLMRAWFRIRVVGEQHIPDEGPVILASNHRSN
ncbi:MAG TPA: hypothetical protein VID07_06235, partial [Actinomycetes bacterium]